MATNRREGGLVLWLTGLSGSGKTTIAKALTEKLSTSEILSSLLDGDELRDGINSDLGFDPRDRCESLRRAAHMASAIADLGAIVVVAMISPYRDDRARARHIIGDERFVEIFVKVPLEIARARDPKGLYEKASNGEIEDFTGLSDPYEEPENPDLTIDTSSMSLEDSVTELLDVVEQYSARQAPRPPRS